MLVVTFGMMFSHQASANGNWLKLANTAPDSVGLMLLLSDGSVIAANNPTDTEGDQGNDWYRLTPDPNGHYVDGEWSRIASMNYKRLFYASVVLTNGMVFVAGGEYPTGGAGGASAELYDPVANTWTLVNPPASLLDGTKVSPGFTPPQNQAFVDANSKVLPNGTVLVRPSAPNSTNLTLIYDPKANAWSPGPNPVLGLGEESWVKLPDDSILTIDPIITDAQGNSSNGFGTNSERYIPSLNKWIADATVPVSVYTPLSGFVGETGPAFLLPSGKAFFLGGNGHTAIYTPSGSTHAGTWVAGPDIPGGLVSADGPAAMMPNGKILCAVAGGPSIQGGTASFPSPTSFFEYDYADGPVGSFSQVDGPTGKTDDIASYQCNMLMLPDGSVLYCHFEQGNAFYSSFGSQLYAYVPLDGTQVTLGNQPTITRITPNPDGSFHLAGTGLSGISEGAAFGDDAQMNSNYPLLEFIDNDNGQIDYARTYNWSSTGVQTGSAAQTTEFTLPAGLVPKTYLVKVIASGVTSAPVTFSFVTPNSLSLCPGESGSLSVITSPQPATYQWYFNGQALPNQTDAQLNFVSAATNQSGLYSLKVSSGNGTYISASVQVSVGVWVIFPPPDTNAAPICQPNMLSVLAQGKGPLLAQWFRNGNLIVLDARITTNSVPQSDGGTVLRLNFADIKYQDDGTYTVVITDDCGPVTTAPFTLRVIPNPPWVQVATTGPSPRWDAAMSYDSDRHVTVLFGGAADPPIGSPVMGDTWEFDGTNWTQRLPATAPVARSMANMVYDSNRHRSVLYGGTVYNGFPAGFAYSPETWEWDGDNWQRIITASLPPWTNTVDFGYAACYDSARKETLVFGGVTSTGIVSQLWGYDGTNWSLKSPAGTAPVYSALCTTMAFDTNRGMAVLVGPVGLSVPNDRGQSVWEWDGDVWHERPQSGQNPFLNNANTAFAYDTFRQECVLYGEENGLVDGVFVDTFYPYPDSLRYVWRWNGQQWQADPPTPTVGVANHFRHSMCFDSARNAMVVFGGQLGTASPAPNFTYEFLYQDTPAVLKQPTVQVSLLGQQAQLSVLAAGAPPINYQWQKEGATLTDGGRISGSTNNTLTINAAVASDSGYYQVVLGNLCGTLTSQPIQLVLAPPLSATISGSELRLTWSDSLAVLQSAPSLVGPWTTVVGAKSPYEVAPSDAHGFFRLLR